MSGAANFNWYDGTTQRLDNSLIVPTAFHKGFGIRPYGSVLVEYRPAGVWGASLNVGYDGRGGKFNEVVAPCNCPADLSVSASYVTVEPSVRLAVPKTPLYFFAGPRIAFNVDNDYAYTQLNQPNTNAQLSGMKKTIVSGQVGAGFEIPLSSPNSLTKFDLSPFVSFQPYFGEAPRSIESWQVTTLRVGIALKFGRGKKGPVKEDVVIAPVVAIPDVTFVVRAPKAVPQRRQVSETLPMLNAVFFDDASTEIPGRYVMLTKDQAGDFKEEQLQKIPSENKDGRSSGQLIVYHNILNIVGYRMRMNPNTTIALNGASEKGAGQGRAFAESVKLYLVTTFGIDGARIMVSSRSKPVIPSEQPGGSKQLALLRAEDNRVDIQSTSPELLMEVGGGMMRPVQLTATQIDPLDSHVLFNVDGAKKAFTSWSVIVTDANGNIQNYGPYTHEHESVPGTAILGNSPTGDYKITMIGQTANGSIIKKESTVHLIKQDDTMQTGLRYSILFDFDKARSVNAYDKFLSGVVSPLITDGATVIIHGHTDIIGEDEYNQKLSESRAQQTQKLLENALAKAGKTNVKFETLGFGEDPSHSPFENNLPEERFYNRTVIIDIIPVK